VKHLAYLLAAAVLGFEAFAAAAGSFRPDYVPPAPGSYRLPVIQRVGDHPLVEAGAGETTLFRLKGHRLAVVAFIYTRCSDADGCPLAQAVLLKLDRDLAADSGLRGQTVLVTVSFDPERDSSEHLARVRDLYGPRADWRFATSPNAQALQRMLDDFGQSVAKLQLADGQWSGLYRHVLKVFLLDREDGVRNVYSAGFLDRDLVLNDLRTLARETVQAPG
jgi:cytochrome oxidase Cu insertion factor (SCO1/SenC/PrrC family)